VNFSSLRFILTIHIFLWLWSRGKAWKMRSFRSSEWFLHSAAAQHLWQVLFLSLSSAIFFEIGTFLRALRPRFHATSGNSLNRCICICVCAYMHTCIHVLGWHELRIYFGWDISELHCINFCLNNLPNMAFHFSKEQIPRAFNNINLNAKLLPTTDFKPWNFQRPQTD